MESKKVIMSETDMQDAVKLWLARHKSDIMPPVFDLEITFHADRTRKSFKDPEANAAFRIEVTITPS